MTSYNALIRKPRDVKEEAIEQGTLTCVREILLYTL